ncbi:MAG: 4-alpha-glucanotransferase [Treponema sp.]|jgi:4-alpha-glucanotransferase|nr:4-alpha-glucanotransferase [Treponema sp.]
MKSTDRLIGTVIPVSALRGTEPNGVGEFLDLGACGQFLAAMGLKLLQILPVNDSGYESSPYSSLSAFALNPLYLRIAALPEAKGFEKECAELGARFDQKPRFPYYELICAKMELLGTVYHAHKKAIIEAAQPGGTLDAWIKEHLWVKEYAIYRRLKDLNGQKSWKDWTSYVHVTKKELDDLWNDKSLESEHIFWVWLQQALDAQLTQAVTEFKKSDVLLKGDIPILIAEDSVDVWAHPELFYENLSAGAPPDIYSDNGQNWGFPAYNWEVHKSDNFAWWKSRLKQAEKYFDVYRIDHVLGFFRLWVTGRENISSRLGHFLPYHPVKYNELENMGFNKGRIRWMTLPHIPTSELWDALDGTENIAYEVDKVCRVALNRVGSEELWLFKDFIHGEKDISVLDVHEKVKQYLIRAWSNRLFFEYEPKLLFPVWLYRESRAYLSLSYEERENIEKLVEKHLKKSEKTWEKEGRLLLTVFCESSSMFPCAEDLGAIPDCVPKVLKELGIFGIRLLRWQTETDENGKIVYIPFEKYPKLTVATTSTHDSSTLREWWNTEVDQQALASFIGEPSLPSVYNPGIAQKILKKFAGAASYYRIFPIQDLLHLSSHWYFDSEQEHINRPGTYNTFNFTYRLPAPLKEILKDEALIHAVKELSTVKMATIPRKPKR